MSKLFFSHKNDLDFSRLHISFKPSGLTIRTMGTDYPIDDHPETYDDLLNYIETEIGIKTQEEGRIVTLHNDDYHVYVKTYRIEIKFDGEKITPSNFNNTMNDISIEDETIDENGIEKIEEELNLLIKQGKYDTFIADIKGNNINGINTIIGGLDSFILPHFLNIQDKNGKTALMLASSIEEIVHTLIDAGAGLNIQNKFGFTALLLASSYDHEKIVQTLIGGGAKVDEQDYYGNTAL